MDFRVLLMSMETDPKDRQISLQQYINLEKIYEYKNIERRITVIKKSYIKAIDNERSNYATILDAYLITKKFIEIRDLLATLLELDENGTIKNQIEHCLNIIRHDIIDLEKIPSYFNEIEEFIYKSYEKWYDISKELRILAKNKLSQKISKSTQTTKNFNDILIELATEATKKGNKIDDRNAIKNYFLISEYGEIWENGTTSPESLLPNYGFCNSLLWSSLINALTTAFSAYNINEDVTELLDKYVCYKRNKDASEYEMSSYLQIIVKISQDSDFMNNMVAKNDDFKKNKIISLVSNNAELRSKIKSLILYEYSIKNKIAAMLGCLNSKIPSPYAFLNNYVNILSCQYGIKFYLTDLVNIRYSENLLDSSGNNSLEYKELETNVLGLLTGEYRKRLSFPKSIFSISCHNKAVNDEVITELTSFRADETYNNFIKGIDRLDFEQKVYMKVYIDPNFKFENTFDSIFIPVLNDILDTYFRDNSNFIYSSPNCPFLLIQNRDKCRSSLDLSKKIRIFFLSFPIVFDFESLQDMEDKINKDNKLKKIVISNFIESDNTKISDLEKFKYVPIFRSNDKTSFESLSYSEKVDAIIQLSGLSMNPAISSQAASSFTIFRSIYNKYYFQRIFKKYKHDMDLISHSQLEGFFTYWSNVYLDIFGSVTAIPLFIAVSGLFPPLAAYGLSFAIVVLPHIIKSFSVDAEEEILFHLKNAAVSAALMFGGVILINGVKVVFSGAALLKSSLNSVTQNLMKRMENIRNQHLRIRHSSIPNAQTNFEPIINMHIGPFNPKYVFDNGAKLANDLLQSDFIKPIINSPAGNCVRILSYVETFMKEKGFTNLKCRGMYMWLKRDVLTDGVFNHFAIVGVRDKVRYVFDLTAHQFQRYSASILDQPLILEESDWLKMFRAAAGIKLIKIKDFDNIVTATTQFSHTFKLPHEIIDGAYILNAPRWYLHDTGRLIIPKLA
ncbi:hypothetical protein M5U04_19745 [Xenorhabdus sp. XENO-1]|uniref:hypothetical protein n=1 Tax=Xenorhabdus bovienii TaxID=40576 RepID=UPI0020CA5619|nr:hypothetical protein [Xenorhabdus bovienii]MCP9270247.1 hypothetical protein [Xenorhabdus bovienii subsp. africana]